MTIQQIIQRLAGMPLDAEVVFLNTETFDSEAIEHVRYDVEFNEVVLNDYEQAYIDDRRNRRD